MDKQAFVAELRKREGDNTPKIIGHVAGVAYFARGLSLGNNTLHIASDDPADSEYFVTGIERSSMVPAPGKRLELTIGKFTLNTDRRLNDVHINNKPRVMERVGRARR